MQMMSFDTADAKILILSGATVFSRHCSVIGVCFGSTTKVPICSTQNPTLVFTACILPEKIRAYMHTKHTPQFHVELRHSCRFSPGSAKEFPTRGESEAGKGSPGQAESLVDIAGIQSKVKNNPEAYTQEARKRSDDSLQQRARGIQSSSALLGTRAPHISALGYFVGDSRRPVTPSGAALHGRALVGNHHPRPSTSKRSLPSPPAVTPGEQPYGVAHPLSPTSMGSPPRRHRNSNWGEEGVRLAAEEMKNSRQTVPFIVSGSLLG